MQVTTGDKEAGWVHGSALRNGEYCAIIKNKNPNFLGERKPYCKKILQNWLNRAILLLFVPIQTSLHDNISNG
jgi:hypothetical protein